MNNTFLWHDYETFGRDSARERPVQFASIRTDEQLQEIDDGTMIYCRQTPDYLPDPESCMVHGVVPQTANQNGLSEFEFAKTIHQLMSQPGTCVAGFNNIRFDDEFTRQLFFRNLYDPYSREWKDGNSRWDLIDTVRLARALRPEGIKWPVGADDKPTNKLELITAANGIDHGDAHDALADVRATIAVARLIKSKQPKLFAYAFQTRNKRWVLGQALDIIKREPVLHISGMYPAKHGHLSMVMPLGPHPTNANGVIVYDLRHNPKDLIKLPAEELAKRIFTPRAELPENVERIQLKTVHANRCPVLVPVKTLDDQAATKWNLDRNKCLEHREQILASDSLLEKLAYIFTRHDKPNADDPDLTLYSGSFFSDRDRNQMQRLQKMLNQGGDINTLTEQIVFEDNRLDELTFRLRARNWPDQLDPQESDRWRKFCHRRVHRGDDGFRNFASYSEAVDTMHKGAQTNTERKRAQMLKEYGESVAKFSLNSL